MSDTCGITSEDGGRPMTQKELRQHAAHEGRIELGLCPNGCGPMMKVASTMFNCPTCNFHYRKSEVKCDESSR